MNIKYLSEFVPITGPSKIDITVTDAVGKLIHKSKDMPSKSLTDAIIPQRKKKRKMPKAIPPPAL